VVDFDEFVPTVSFLVYAVLVDKVPHIRGSITSHAQRRGGEVYTSKVGQLQRSPIFESNVGSCSHIYSVCEYKDLTLFALLILFK